MLKVNFIAFDKRSSASFSKNYTVDTKDNIYDELAILMEEFRKEVPFTKYYIEYEIRKENDEIWEFDFDGL